MNSIPLGALEDPGSQRDPMGALEDQFMLGTAQSLSKLVNPGWKNAYG